MYSSCQINTFQRIFLFLFFCFLISCNTTIDEQSKLVSVQDSINFYYKEALNESYLESTKLEKLEKGYKLVIKYDNHSINGLNTLYTKSLQHYLAKEKDSFFIVSDLLLARAKSMDNKEYQAMYHDLVGSYYRRLNKTDKALYNLNEAKKLYIQIKDSIKLGRNLINIATLQKNRNDYHGAEETAVEALTYLKNSEDKKYIASIHSLLGKIQRELLRYEDAVGNYNIAIKKTPSKKDRLEYENNLAAMYNDFDEHSKAIELLHKIKQDSLLKKHKKLEARVIDNLAYAKWLKNPEANVIDEFLLALKIRNSINDITGLFASYTHLAEYYVNKDVTKTIEYGEKVIANSRVYRRPNAELDVLRIIHTVKPNDITIRDRFIALRDSMDVEEKKARNLFAKAKYDTKEAKRENEKLQLDNAKKDLENERQQQQKTIISIIAVAIVFIAIIYFYFLYQKHRREKALQVYNTETRISKKVHDELANDVYNVMVILQKSLKNKTPLPPKVLNQVEDIYVRTRNISHENHSIDTGEDFVDGLREMISDFNTEEVAIIVKDIEYPAWETIENYVKIIIHRVLQELMVNMKKHSKANVVVLTFSTKDKKLMIHYSDNGIGLPFIKASKKGLLNMENRIQSAQGSLNFDSESGKGLKLSMTFPI
ncbi:hypothetical protein U8527_02485 [Kordia algicida OT-1]|uniref:histidine kinase n=1 Tax=Kordia algicida OT-1 TaxID=391587 RepID=A9DNF4_9FLAO|nr:ATP-binding protein [Kordia algicida]EDP97178.1 histidine kinase, putative [Kordia algicida OT-1]